MSIRQTKEGKYYYRFQYDHRDYCEGGFRTKRQALDAETRARDRAIDGLIKPNQTANTMSFAELGAKYLKESPKKRSIKNDEDRIRVMSSPFKTTQVQRLTAKTIRDVLDDLQKTRNFSDHTWNHYHATVRKVINWAKKQELFSGDNPAEKIPQKKIERARVRFLNLVEEQLVTAMVSNDKVVWSHYWLALKTGMRASEVARLRAKNVSFITNTIFVERGKGYKSRYVPIPDECRDLLKECLVAKGPEQYLLSGLSATWISTRFKRLAELAGITDIIFHDLRHTYAYNRLTNGVDIYMVCKLMGHSAVKVTQDHYGHFAMGDLQKATNKTTRLNTVEASAKSCNEVAMEILPPLGFPRGV